MELANGPEYNAQHHPGDLFDFAVDYNNSQLEKYDDITHDDYNFESDYIDDPLYYSNTYRIVGATVGTSILIIGFILNSFLIHIVRKCPSMFLHTPARSLCRLLIYLSVADCLVLGTSCLLHVIELFLIFNEWVFGKAGCTVLVFLQYFSNDIVGLAILLLAVERYSTYSRKDSSFMTRTGLAIFLACLLAVAFCSPWIALSRTLIVEYHDIPENIYVEECTFNISMGALSIYYLFDSIIFYLVPLFAAVVLYIVLFTPVDRMQALDRQKGDAERRVYWMLCASTVVAFGCAVLPFRTMILFNSFAKNKFLNLWFLLFARMTMYMGSALRPLIYLAFSRKFRRGFRNELFCRRRTEDCFQVEMEASML